MVKIVFTDTNKIMGLYSRIARGKTIHESIIAKLTSGGTHMFFLSSFVLNELKRICVREEIDYTQENVKRFLDQTGFRIIESDTIDPIYTQYVFDYNDAQIVQDAVTSESQYILTHNIKDFNVDAIYTGLSIEVITDLFDIG